MVKAKKFKHVTRLPILKYSGFSPKFDSIEIVKKQNYTVIKGVSITGDAPKDIIRLYNYGEALKRNPSKWPIYIAKLGHKYYPLESITEQLISDIGKWFGFELADSKICYIGGQIRFLSKYFIKKNTDELYHGADLYAGYLLNDKEFVDQVELNKMTQSFFTIGFTKEVIRHFFKDSHEQIFHSFMKMLFFDALIGNNDRHMYNWGVIRDVYGQNLAKFSPIYDSARGLLWNEQEDRILKVIDEKRVKSFINKYCKNSRPKIGIENKPDVNHFELISSYSEYYQRNELVQKIFKNKMLDDVIEKINVEYKTLFSKERRFLIIEVIRHRYAKLEKIVTL